MMRGEQRVEKRWRGKVGVMYWLSRGEVKVGDEKVRVLHICEQ